MQEAKKDMEEKIKEKKKKHSRNVPAGIAECCEGVS